MSDRVRYLARGWPDYTTDPRRQMLGEPEPVDDDWLVSITSSATTRHEEFTMRRAAEHGIRAVLRSQGPTDSATAKLRVAEALDCDIRTVERAARDMSDLERRRGYRSATSWLLATRQTPGYRGAISAHALRVQIEQDLLGERQSPRANCRDVAAELIADEWSALMADADSP